MTEVQKTIRMPKELLAKWLEALRSGEYAQGDSILRGESRNGRDSFCCLGVLQMVADGDVERDLDGRSETGPTEGWLFSHGVEFTCKKNGDGDPFLPTISDETAVAVTAMYANDDLAVPFPEIADAIEACAEGY